MRGIPGSFIEVFRYKKDEKQSTMSLANEGIKHFFYGIALFSLITMTFGLYPAIFSLVQGVLCMIMIETVNYVEHYGLERKKDADGMYEPVNIRHSWNAP
jgi:alkane 1-monooxygenase